MQVMCGGLLLVTTLGQFGQGASVPVMYFVHSWVPRPGRGSISVLRASWQRPGAVVV